MIITTLFRQRLFSGTFFAAQNNSNLVSICDCDLNSSGFDPFGASSCFEFDEDLPDFDRGWANETLEDGPEAAASSNSIEYRLGRFR